MYRMILFLLLFFCNLLFGVENAEIIKKQFQNTSVKESLVDKIPYLQQNFMIEKAVAMPTKNQYTLKFDPNDALFGYFSRITGRSIFNAKFIVSWYIFTNKVHIPSSSEKIMELVNQEKPIFFGILTAINGKWISSVELPFDSVREKNYIFAYISYPNTDGVLVPLGSQSFYFENISGHFLRERRLALNREVLAYWKNKGYL